MAVGLGPSPSAKQIGSVPQKGWEATWLCYLYTLNEVIRSACEAKCGQVCTLPFQPMHAAEAFHCLATSCCRALEISPAVQC